MAMLEFEKDFNAIFSKRLRYYIDKYELTQSELAERLGVSAQSVSNWCKGTKSPRMDKVDAMCKIFHCKRSDLIEEKDVEPDTDLTIIQRERSKMSEKEKTKLMNILKANFDEYNWEEDDSGDIE